MATFLGACAPPVVFPTDEDVLLLDDLLFDVNMSDGGPMKHAVETWTELQGLNLHPLSDEPQSPGARSGSASGNGKNHSHPHSHSHSPSIAQLTPSSAYSSFDPFQIDGLGVLDAPNEARLASPAVALADDYVLVSRASEGFNTRPQGHLTSPRPPPLQGALQGTPFATPSRPISEANSQGGDAPTRWTPLDSSSECMAAPSASQESPYGGRSDDEFYDRTHFLAEHSSAGLLDEVGTTFGSGFPLMSTYGNTTATTSAANITGNIIAFPPTDVHASTLHTNAPISLHTQHPQSWNVPHTNAFPYPRWEPASQLMGAHHIGRDDRDFIMSDYSFGGQEDRHPLGQSLLPVSSRGDGAQHIVPPQPRGFRTNTNILNSSVLGQPASVVPSRTMSSMIPSNLPPDSAARMGRRLAPTRTEVNPVAPPLNLSPQHGRRGGRLRGSNLPETARQKSHTTRKIGACWLCALQRDPCGGGNPCTRCKQRMNRSQSLAFPCDRSKLTMLVHDFLPQSMTSMHHKQTIEDDVSREVGIWYKSDPIDVQLTCGYGPNLRWRLYEFHPRTNELLSQMQFSQDRSGRSICRRKYSPPLGVLELNSGQDDIRFETYLDASLSDGYLWEFGWTCFEEEAQIDDFQPRLLQAMCDLYLNSDDEYGLREHLKQILRMILITYIMGHTLTFAEDTRPDIIHRIKDPTKPASVPIHTSPRLANRQLKFFFNILRNKIYDKILNWQQQTMHSSRDKEGSWLPCFCATLGFAMVLEEIQRTLQIQADAKSAKNEMPHAEAMTEAHNACERIDKRFDLLVGLFRTKYRSKKWTMGSFGNATPELTDLAQVRFAREVRSLLEEKAEHLRIRKNVKFSQENQCLYTSRLVARFLLPFLSLPP